MKTKPKCFLRMSRTGISKLLFAFLGMIVSGAILFTATISVAWLAQNRRTEARSLEIRTVQGDAEATYTVYKWKYEEGNLLDGYGTNLSDEQTLLTLDSDFSLNTHDVVFIGENIYTVSIVRIELTGSRYQGTYGTLSITLTRSTEADDAENPLNEKISSVATFSCMNRAIAYDANADIDHADTVYRSARALFCGADGKLKTGENAADFTTKAFATYETTATEDGMVYSDFAKNLSELTFEVSYESEHWRDGKLYVYFCIGYDDVLAEEVVFKGSSNFSTFIDIGNTKYIENDLSAILEILTAVNFGTYNGFYRIRDANNENNTRSTRVCAFLLTNPKKDAIINLYFLFEEATDLAKVHWKGSALLSPVPAAMVTCALGEEKNIITVAWTGIVNSQPPKTYISIRPSRHSYEMIRKSGEFVIHPTPSRLVRAADWCGIHTGAKTDKFKHCRLTPESASEISAPLIAECPLALECRVTDILPLGSHDLFLADIVAVDADESLLDDEGKLRIERADLIAYAHGDYYQLGRRLGKFGFSVAKRKANHSKS